MAAQGFVWFELETSDIDAAMAFYAPLLGWTAHEFPDPAARYLIGQAGGKAVAGIGGMPADGRPQWLGYVGTADMDASVAAWTGAGGALLRGPRTIEGVGRLVLLADPQGAALAMLEPASAEPNEAFKPYTPGHGNWTELATPDPPAALAFYSGQLGWTSERAMDMGPMGQYHLFEVDGVQTGGIMRAIPGMPVAWLYYFGVPSVAAAITAIGAAGGTVLRGPQPVPGDTVVAIAVDPQGAAFAVHGGA